MAGTLPAALTLGSMSTSGPARHLRLLEVPPGPEALDALWEPLAAALAGGQPIAPIPVTSSVTAPSVVDSLIAAVRPDEPVAEDTALVVTTSGSTGNPRGVELQAAAADHLTEQVNARASGDPAWVLAIPPTSIGGLNVLIRARRTHQPPIPTASLGGAQRFTDEVFAEAIDTAAGTGQPVAVSLVPAQLPRLLATELGRASLQRCALILVGGAALAPQAARDCAAASISVTSTYGMTETSGGCVLDGVPLDGVQIRIGEEGSNDDRIWLSGPMLASRYRDDDPHPFVDGWLRTNDRGRWSGGRLQVLGRLDDIVTVRGVNVDIVAIEDRVRDHPSIVDAIVIVVPDDDVDSRLHLAFIADDDIPEAALRAWVSDHLGKEAAPATIRQVASFQATTTGKIDRQATARTLGLDEEETHGPGGDLW